MQLTPGGHSGIAAVGQQQMYGNPTVGSMRPFNMAGSNSGI